MKLSKFNLSSILLFSLFVGYSCSMAPTRTELKATDAPKLTEEEAKFRSNKVSDVKYELIFDLSEKKESYEGVSLIKFNLSDSSTDLRLDFYRGKISQLLVNKRILNADYNQHYILIKSEDLVEGLNSIEVSYTKDYSRNGSGFYRFVDPKDKNIYTYTDLEPFDANQVFPCFDQPNLKASYKMTVHAPKNWQVVTSTLPNSIDNNKEFKTWNFPVSTVFSTYIWSLHAGPYHVFTDKKAKYPSRVFVRQSLKKYVNTEDWFTFTRQSFEFLDEYFGYPYPYKKYDQLIVPDFNAGAMENVAAVTFSEGYVSRGIKPESLRRRHANVIFHEMAHMWFGNLVTMDWWNDLWLNESFATYIANLGVSRNTVFKKKAFKDFRGTKEWALWEDQLVTTHPIEANVPDTTQAFANFDGITYGKGASSLKQIHYYLGEMGFKKGLQTYFKRHANSNTKLKDFMNALSDGSSKDLKVWQKKWLQTTGVNTIATAYSCKDNKIDSFNVIQKDLSKNDHIRPHAFEIAFVNELYNVENVIKVNISERSKMIPEAISMNCPKMVFPNYNDHDYIMVQLDSKTLVEMQKNINKVSDSFLRQLLWSTLWQMVYYGQYSYKDYAKLVETKAISTEQDDKILSKVLGTIYGRRSNAPSVMFYGTHDFSLTKKARNKMVSSFEDKILKRLKRSKPKSEIQKILYRSYVRVAESDRGVFNIMQILDGSLKFKGLAIDQDKRWSLILKLNAFNHKYGLELARKESLKDGTSRGKKMMIASEAIRPDWATKQKWIAEYLKNKSKYSFSDLKTVLRNLFPRHQSKLRSNYVDFFKDMNWVNNNKSLDVAEKFTVLSTQNCLQETINAQDKFIKRNPDLQAGVLKEMLISHQENKRCLEVIKISN